MQKVRGLRGPVWVSAEDFDLLEKDIHQLIFRHELGDKLSRLELLGLQLLVNSGYNYAYDGMADIAVSNTVANHSV